MRIAVASLFVLWAFLLAASCQPVAVDTNVSQVVTPSETAESTPPTEGDISVTPSLPTPAVPGLQNLIETARTDLAQRLGVSVDEIALLEAARVTWPDSSLGCPKEGMQYAQVLTPGYLIRLQSEGRVFEYHASKGTTVIYCENPSPPVEGTPGDV